MADPPELESTTSTPRWVKVFGIITIVVILLFVVQLLRGGRHGPSRHRVSDSGLTPLAEVGEVLPAPEARLR